MPVDEAANLGAIELALAFSDGPSASGIVCQARVGLQRLSVLDAVSAERDQARNTVDSLRKQLVQESANNARLGTLISAMNTKLPTKIDPARAPHVMGDVAITQFHLNRPGRIRVYVYQLSNGTPVQVNRIDRDNAEQDPVIRIPNLGIGNRYALKAVVVDLADKETSVKTDGLDATAPDYDGRLVFETKALPAPGFSTVSVNPAFNQLTFDVEVAPNAAVGIELYRKQPGADNYQLLSAYGDKTDLNEFDEPKAPTNAFAPTHRVTVSGLDASTVYAYRLLAVSPDGKQQYSPGGLKEVSTKAPAPRFEFAEGVDVRVDITTGLSLTWQATSDAKSAYLKLLFPGDTSITIPAVLQNSGKTLSVLVGTDKLTRPKGSDPLLTVAMTNESGEEKSIQLRFGIGVASVTNGQTSDQAKRIVDGIAHPADKKFSWQDLITVGLGVFLGR